MSYVYIIQYPDMYNIQMIQRQRQEVVNGAIVEGCIPDHGQKYSPRIEPRP